MGIYVKFIMTTYQIWSCHVTLSLNSENVYFPPNSILNFRKSYQIWGKLAQEQKSYRLKTNWGWNPPHRAYRINIKTRYLPSYSYLKVGSFWGAPLGNTLYQDADHEDVADHYIS